MHHCPAKTEDPAADAKQSGIQLQREEASLEVHVYTAFEQMPSAYMRLFEQAGRQSVFLTLPWFQNLGKTALDASDQVRIYGIADLECAEVLAATFVARSSGQTGRLSSMRKLTALANYYTPFFGPHFVASGNQNREALRALARRIAAEKPRWDAIEIKPLDLKSETFSALAEELEAAGFVVQTYFCAGNWYEPVNGRSYREYFEGLRSSVRNIAKSKNKKIERSGRVRIEIMTDGEGLERGIAAYNKVYASSWKIPEPYPEFVPGLIRTCATQGTLRLGLAYVDGEPAAAQIWIVHSGVASIYKIAYDRKFRELSVGTYLTTKLMEHVIDQDRVNEVDYLTGDDEYKKDWMSQRRERWGILAMNPRTPRGALAIVRHVGGRAVKRAVLSLTSRVLRRYKLAAA